MKTSIPKVSILIPIFNVEKYLRQCLESVVGQTLKDIQIICLNDGSTDSSLDIIKEFAKDDKRIVIVDKKNSGYGDSMNVGLSKATGKYIGIVESDDYIELNAFEKLYDLAEKFDADVARSNYYHMRDNKSALYSYVEKSDTNKLVDPEKSLWIFYQAPAIWSAIYRNDFLKEHNIKFLPTPGASYQDTGFNFKVWASTHKAVFTEEAFLHYRLDNESSSINNPGKVFNACIEYKEIEKYLKANNLFHKYGKVMEAAKFGAYYWNIYRLAPDLRKDFVKKAKEEYTKAQKNNLLDKTLFLDENQWNLIQFMIKNSVDNTLVYIQKHKKTEPSAKLRAKGFARKVILKVNPFYRKQLEISKLISELEIENKELKKHIEELEKKAKTNNE